MLRRFYSAASIKLSTGITGLPAEGIQARSKAINLYEQLLQKLNPAGSLTLPPAYVTTMKSLATERLTLLKSPNLRDVDVEAREGLQLEEMSREIESELQLIDKLRSWS